MKLESTEIQAPLPAIAKIVITFYVSMALVCAALIGSMTAIHKGWVKVASLEPKSPALKVPQVTMGFPQAKQVPEAQTASEAKLSVARGD